MYFDMVGVLPETCENTPLRVGRRIVLLC